MPSDSVSGFFLAEFGFVFLASLIPARIGNRGVLVKVFGSLPEMERVIWLVTPDCQREHLSFPTCRKLQKRPDTMFLLARQRAEPVRNPQISLRQFEAPSNRCALRTLTRSRSTE
jgi:hypothetical protein